MFQTITFYHSILRWLVIASLAYSIYRAWRGYSLSLQFSRIDNSVRHWTATIAHIQMVVGILLYTQSPMIEYFWGNFNQAVKDSTLTFFGLIHFILMLTAIIFITMGSALAKRKTADKEKFKTMLIWFIVSLLIILIAIPWPFSPLASRPYFR